MKKLILFLVLLIAFDLGAQEGEVYLDETDTEFQMGGYFQVGVPILHLGENIRGGLFGGGGNLFYKIKKETPLYVGLDFSYLVIDSEAEDQQTEIDGIFYDTRLRTASNLLTGHALLRFMPYISERVYPYAEGMVGFQNFFTRTVLRDTDLGQNNILDSYIEESDWGLSLGASVGLHIPLGSDGVRLDTRLTYIRAASMGYFVRSENPPLVQDNLIDRFEFKNSTSDLLIPQVGITISIGIY